MLLMFQRDGAAVHVHIFACNDLAEKPLRKQHHFASI